MAQAIGFRTEFFAFLAVFFRLAGGERSRCVRDQEKKTAKNAKTRKEREWDRAMEVVET